MRGKKKVKAYVPEALEYFGKSLLMVRNTGSIDNNKFSMVHMNLDGLQKAIQALPKPDRENIEKFWGLTGGPNHSKKLIHNDAKDIAYIEMRNAAVKSLRKLLTLDYSIMYDPTVSAGINIVVNRTDMEGLDISDTECTKYLMAYIIYADNGPKMCFEDEPMSVDTDLNEGFLFDEYEVLNQMCEELKEYPDHSINLRLLISFFEMIDFKHMLAIKKSMGIEIPKDSLPENFDLEDIQLVQSVSSIRELKESIFPYGAWDVVNELILGNKNGKINLDNFMKELDEIRKDWAKVREFKSGERILRTAKEVRTLDVYNIGGLEFTDIYEVMFLYLERNLIAPEL